MVILTILLGILGGFLAITLLFGIVAVIWVLFFKLIDWLIDLLF